MPFQVSRQHCPIELDLELNTFSPEKHLGHLTAHPLLLTIAL